MSDIGFVDPDAPLDPEAPYDAGDRRAVKEKQKAARLRDEANKKVLRQLMGSNEGRAWTYELLSLCHVYQSAFSTNALSMACAEGERNIGLRILGELMLACPERYIEMLKEANGERSDTRS
jgi:hypothetical protein